MANYTIQADVVKIKISDVSGYTYAEEIDELNDKVIALSGQSLINTTDIAELEDRLDEIHVPTKVSELTNDSGYINAVPSEYVTEAELDAKGYVKASELGDTFVLKNDVMYQKLLNNAARYSNPNSQKYFNQTNENKVSFVQYRFDGGYSSTVDSISAATEQYAGVMSAQQVKDLNYVKGIQFATINGQPITSGGNISIAVDTEIFQYADELPTEEIKTNKIYVVPSQTVGENNIYTEWIYINNAWEIVGQFKTDTDLTNYYTKAQIDAKGYLTSETDPTVPEWAKEPNKPTYTADEVGALANTTYIPTSTNDLINDSGFITEGDVPKNTSDLNNDSGYITIDDVPTIPTSTNQLVNDSGFVDAQYVSTECYNKTEIDTMIGGLETQINNINSMVV